MLDKDECSYDGMIAILDTLQKYVPSKQADHEMAKKIPGNELEREKIFITVLVGGDQLSTSRARGALYIRGSSELEEDRLKGFLPVAEDWHGKVCFMQVCVSHGWVCRVYLYTHRCNWVKSII